MVSQIKGLHQFIADLRSVESREDESKRINSEIVNIQKQFNSNDSLSGYQRKKYILKLIYIFLTSGCNEKAFNVKFGNQHIISLISSNVYSEKFTGYLALSLIWDDIKDNHGSEINFTDLMINSLKKDLNSSNVESNLLALDFIANIGNSIWSELLIEDVFQLLRSPTSIPTLKKKSSLAMLKLVKSNKESLLRHPNWIPRILSVVDDNDLNVVLSIIPLIEFISLEIDLKTCQAAIPTLTRKLSLLILEPEKVPTDLFFAKIANPWLIVKITKLLTVLIPDDSTFEVDLHSLRTLRECVASVIEFASRKTPSDSSIRNAQNSVLFSMITLAGHLDPSIEALNSSVDAITSLLDSHELNTKYLALNALITLNSKTNSLKNSQRHLLKIFQLLKDNQDISICKKSLDLIYVISDSDSIEFIVSELLKLLQKSDHLIKQDVAIKISILSEKFAKTPKWFVSTMLELIDLSGNSLNESIWERVVQIIVNNESLQSYTCTQIIKFIDKQNFSESMVKIASYVLGEFGISVSNDFPIQKQFDVLGNLYFYVSNNTRSMLLTTFMKYLKYDPHNKTLKSNVIKILRLEFNSINSELQQRSFEYLTLIQHINEPSGQQLFSLLFDEIPVFNTKQNPLLLKLGKTNIVARKQLVQSTDNLTQKLKQTSIEDKIDEEDYDDSGIDPFGNDVQPIPIIQKDGPLTPNWQSGFYRLFEFNQGVFFENSLIKILLRISKNPQKPDTISVSLTFTNKSPNSINSFITNFTNSKSVNPPFIINSINVVDNQISPNAKTSSHFEVLLRSPNLKFEDIANLRIQFNAGGGFNSIRLKLPIFLNKFFTSTNLTNEQFQHHWGIISSLGSKGEGYKQFKVNIELTDVWIERVLQKLGFGLVVDGIDQLEGYDFLASSILHTSTGKNGVLIKLKLDGIDTLQIKVRATSEYIGDAIVDYLYKYFNH